MNNMTQTNASQSPSIPNRSLGTNNLRILVVDDHGIVRDGVSAVLERNPNLKVVETAATGKEAVSAATRLVPEVVVMDLMLPELSGVDATERILALLPQTHIIILSMCHTSEHIFRALRAGARGYVVKEAAGADLVRAVLAVTAGERFLVGDFPTTTRTGGGDRDVALTDRGQRFQRLLDFFGGSVVSKFAGAFPGFERDRERVRDRGRQHDRLALVRGGLEADLRRRATGETVRERRIGSQPCGQRHDGVLQVRGGKA